MNSSKFCSALTVTLSALVSSNALSTSTSQPPATPDSIWWLPLGSAFIGAVSGALVTPFIKDFLIQRLNEKRSKVVKQQEIYHNYAAPLAAASAKLAWRFSEIFLDKRHHFLKSATLPLVYNEYKRTSTLYRIACLLGWVRAMHLEVSSLPRGASAFLTPLSDAIDFVQRALADGPDVELGRLKQVCCVWGLSLDPTDEARTKSLAANLEIRLYESAGDQLKHDSNYLRKLEDRRKLTICLELSSYLSEELRLPPIDRNTVLDTISPAIAALSHREALIYRDWQDAIGDTMLEPDLKSVRRYKIVGYERFEELLKGSSQWMTVFRNSIVDIDFDATNPNDFRATQLTGLAYGVSQILIALADRESDLVDRGVLDLARTLASLRPSS